MPTIVTRHLREAVRQDSEPLNVLLFGVAHERYLSLLAKTGHNFIVLKGQGLKDWERDFAEVPSNVYLHDVGRPLPLSLPVDLVMSESRVATFQHAQQTSFQAQIPHVTLEHVQPPPAWGPRQLAPYVQMRGDVDVFISRFSREAWGFGEGVARVIEHAVDPIFVPPPPGTERQKVALSVVNRWRERDAECGWSFWNQAMKELPVAVLGDNPGFSRKASGPQELAAAYGSALLFVNTSQVSPVPMTLLEAGSCGACIVSTRNPMIESVIDDGRNGFLADSPEQMRRIVKDLLDNPSRAEAVGTAASEDIRRRFGLDRFVAEWRAAFEDAFRSNPLLRRP